MVELSRSKGNALAVSGHPVEGWMGLLLEVDGITRAADISTPLSQEKIIQIFQACAQGDSLWEKEFEWDIIVGKTPVGRIIILVMILLAVLFFGRNCAK